MIFGADILFYLVDLMDVVLVRTFPRLRGKVFACQLPKNFQLLKIFSMMKKTL